MPGVDLDEYKRTLIERFSNPGVRDTIPRLCAESSDRIPKWLLRSCARSSSRGARSRARRRSSRAGRATPRASTRTASRSRSSTGAPRSSTEIAQRQRDEPDAFIANRDLFGDLADDERFAEAYRSALRSLHERGARATLEALAAD